MRKINMRTIVVLIVLAFTGSAFAQDSGPGSRLTTRNEPESELDNFDRWNPYYSSDGLRASDRRLYARIASEGRVLKKGLLAASASDRSRFASFLSLRNTGLTRLLPREVYDAQITHTKSPVSIRGGGAFYSFASLTHVYGYGSDIELSRNQFSVGFAGADYGMLTMLGDTPLEQITAEEPRAHFIATYQPAATRQQVNVEKRRFAQCWGRCTPIGGGSVIDGLHYGRSMPVVENSTYLVRSIAYDLSDALVAFRVIGKDADGGVTIAWKLLQQYRAPALRRGK